MALSEAERDELELLQLKKRKLELESELTPKEEVPEEEGPGMIMQAAEAVESRTGAPSRQGLSTLLETGSVGEAASAFGQQFGEPSQTAATGDEIAQQLGIPKEQLFSEETVKLANEKPWLLNPVIIGALNKAGVTKSGAAGLGIELATDFTNLIAPGASALGKSAKLAKGVKKVRAALKGAGGRMAFKALAQTANLGDLEKAQPEIMGRIVMDLDVGKTLDPAKLTDKLLGTTKVDIENLDVDLDLYDVFKERKKGGVISDLSNELRSNISKISDHKNANTINREALKGSILLKMDRNLAPLTDEKLVESIAKTMETALESVPKKMSIRDAQKLKQKIGEKLNTKVFKAPPDANTANKKQAMKELYFGLKESIEDASVGTDLVDNAGNVIDGAQYIKAQNQRISTLMQISKISKSASLKGLKEPGLIQGLIQSGIGGVTGAAAGFAFGTDPRFGALLGAGVGAGAGMSRKLTRPMAAMGARGLTGAANVSGSAVGRAGMATSLGPNMVLGSQEDQLRQQSRDIDSVAEELPLVKLPRNSKDLLEQKELVKAKAAQEFGPETFAAVVHILEEDPGALDKMLPALIQEFPQAFETDKYDRINGIISDPIMKQQAEDDLWVLAADDEIGTMEATVINKQLNRTGEFPL